MKDTELIFKKGKKEIRAGYVNDKVVLIFKEGRKKIIIELETVEAEILSEKLERLAYKKSYDAWESVKKVVKDLENKKTDHLTEEQRRHLLDPDNWYDFEMSH